MQASEVQSVPIDLSACPERLFDPSLRVIEAGPGSGKTEALVARFIRVASELPPLQGVALLSFTNAAVDEVKRRAVSKPELTSAPNFVGTIDAFLHRFIVSPIEVQRLGRLPSYRASWEDLPPSWASVRLYRTAGAGIQLKHFRMNQEGSVTFARDEISWVERTYLVQLETLGKGELLLNRAGALIRGLNKNGVYDANTARVKAFSLLQGPSGEAIVKRLTTRFVEILVDEAQDCDEAEFSVIRQLAEGARSVIVADPDQAIFAFRGGDSQLFTSYRDEQSAGVRGELSVNYRSSKAICLAVSALRTLGRAQIRPHSQSECAPVFILSGTTDQQRAKFVALLGEYSITLTEAAVLAHRRADAAALAGDSHVGGTESKALGNKLAAFAGVLRLRDSPPNERLRAVEGIEQIIMSLVQWPEELVAANRSTQLDSLGRNQDWLRSIVGHLVSRLEFAATQEQFGSQSRDVLSEALLEIPFGCGTLKGRVKKPNDAFWSLFLVEERQQGLHHETIHGAKGSQFQAVLVGLPDKLPSHEGKTVLDDWTADVNTEPRRVLYVGASRAQRLLAFGAGPHSIRLEQLLTKANVPLELR